MIKIIKNIDSQIYNQHAPHPLQLFEWGASRESLGTPIVRFGEYDDKENLLNVFQMSLHKVPFTNFNVGYIPRSKIPNDQFLVFLKNYCKENNIIFVKFEPNGFLGEENIPKILVKSKSPIFYDATRIIDISLPEDTLKTNLEKKTRYNINLAIKNGVVVSEESNNTGFEEFSKLFFEVAKKRKYGGHDYAYHKTIWDNLNKSGVAKIFLAKYKGRTLAVYEVFVSNGFLYTPYSGTSDEFKNVKAKNLLLWEIILSGKKYGASKVDLWGTLKDGEKGQKSWKGFSDFKRGYGGEVRETVGSFDLIINNFWYIIFTLLSSLRKMVRNILRL
jgi:peptidoglycan pentaglycine glycine transferase (the first glycine)